MRLIQLAQGAFCELYEGWIQALEAAALMQTLLAEVAWEHKEIELYGRQVLQPRLVSWVGDPEAVYTYSRTRHEPRAWTPSLALLRQRIEQTTGTRFNSVLCNLYRDGRDSMGMHSDREPELGPDPVVASLSLGASRRFCLRQRVPKGKSGQDLDLELESGTLLVMGGSTQTHYRHGVPRQLAVRAARINLTFRQVFPQLSAVSATATSAR